MMFYMPLQYASVFGHDTSLEKDTHNLFSLNEIFCFKPLLLDYIFFAICSCLNLSQNNSNPSENYWN